jgi:pilus assembly protein TadC
MNISIFFTVLRLFHMTNDFFIKGITSGFLGGHIAMLIHGWSIANFYTIMNMEVFWFVVAMLMILYSNHIKKIFEEEEEIPGAMTPRQMRT